MTLSDKPFKCFETLDHVVVREGADISFTTTTGLEVEGCVLKISAKEIKIKEEEEVYSKSFSYSDIEEGSLKLQ